MTRDLISGLWTASGPPSLSSPEWEALLAQARATRLSARLSLHIQRLAGGPSAVPRRVEPHLESALRISAALHINVKRELRHLARALQPLGTPVVLLKGAAYVAADLPAAAGRLFSDIDILVRRDRLRDAEQALFAAGWMAEKLEPYDDRYYRQWMHELPPLRHVQRHSHVDVHHTLAPPTSRYVIDGDEVISRAVLLGDTTALPQSVAKVFRVLAPTDMVLHSALHLMQEGEFDAGLRDLLDIRDLLLHHGADDDFWPALQARARALGLESLLLQVLLQLRRLFGLNPPASWRWPDLDRQSAVLQSLLSRVLAPHAVGEESATTRLARSAMYVRSHWLRMPWYQIVPHISRKAWARLAHRTDDDAATEAPRA